MTKYTSINGNFFEKLQILIVFLNLGHVIHRGGKNRWEKREMKRRPFGSVSNNDHDGYENVTKKVNSRCLKLDRAYSIPFNSTNADNFLWS